MDMIMDRIMSPWVEAGEPIHLDKRGDDAAAAAAAALGSADDRAAAAEFLGASAFLAVRAAQHGSHEVDRELT